MLLFFKCLLPGFFIFSLFSSNAQIPPASPIIHWEGPRLAELGSFSRNETNTAVFTFTNLSLKPLIIDNIRTSCGCTVAEWPSAPVLPKEKGKITIEVRPSKRGYFEQHVKVYFHGQRQAERLNVRGVAE